MSANAIHKTNGSVRQMLQWLIMLNLFKVEFESTFAAIDLTVPESPHI